MTLGLLLLTLQQLQTPPRPRHLHHQRFRTIKFCAAISIESNNVERVFKCNGHCNDQKTYTEKKGEIRPNKERGIEDKPTFLHFDINLMNSLFRLQCPTKQSLYRT